MIDLLLYAGQLKPYLPSNDDTIMFLLLLCFFVSSITLARNKKLFIELGSNLWSRSKSTSNYSSTIVPNTNDLLPLILQTCITIGILFFVLIDHNFPHNIVKIDSWLIISAASLVSIIYIIFKWAVYSFIGWIFNTPQRTKDWLEIYCTILYYLGIILYIFVLLIVYSDIAVNTILYTLLGLLILTKCLILYRCGKFFPNKVYGHILLFLYFCALEIIPYAILYRVMTRTIMF